MDMKMDPNQAAASGGGADALDGLMHYPALLVKQKRKGALLELLCNWESNNKYKVYNPEGGAGSGQEILIADESSSCMCRQFCGAARETAIQVTTVDGQEIVYLERPLQGRMGCFQGIPMCCLEFAWQKMTVFSGQNTANPRAVLGFVKEQFSCCIPELTVLDAGNVPQYKIFGDCFLTNCCNYKLTIYAPDDTEKTTELGTIKKKWAGAMKELFTDADNFFITFPQNATAQQRALLLGALFLIDFLYFERGANEN